MRIGIDFGGTNIAVGIVDGNYRILYKTSAPTRLGRPVDEMVLDMAKLCLNAPPRSAFLWRRWRRWASPRRA